MIQENNPDVLTHFNALPDVRSMHYLSYQFQEYGVEDVWPFILQPMCGWSHQQSHAEMSYMFPSIWQDGRYARPSLNERTESAMETTYLAPYFCSLYMRYLFFYFINCLRQALSIHPIPFRHLGVAVCPPSPDYVGPLWSGQRILTVSFSGLDGYSWKVIRVFLNHLAEHFTSRCMHVYTLCKERRGLGVGVLQSQCMK